MHRPVSNYPQLSLLSADVVSGARNRADSLYLILLSLAVAWVATANRCEL